MIFSVFAFTSQARVFHKRRRLTTCSTMSQKAIEAESGESPQLPGPGKASLNTEHLSGEKEPNVSVEARGTATSCIKQLLGELKLLYEQRFRCLALDTSMPREELLQVTRTIFLQLLPHYYNGTP